MISTPSPNRKCRVDKCNASTINTWILVDALSLIHPTLEIGEGIGFEKLFKWKSIEPTHKLKINIKNIWLCSFSTCKVCKSRSWRGRKLLKNVLCNKNLLYFHYFLQIFTMKNIYNRMIFMGYFNLCVCSIVTTQRNL